MQRIQPRRLLTALLPDGVWTGLIVALGVVPFLFSDYWTFTFSTVFIYVIATMGLDFVFGRTGQLSLAHAAFFGIGAYVTAMTATHVPAIPQLGLIIAIAIVAGVVVGIPTLRLSGLRLAVVTLLFGQLFIWALNHGGTLTNSSQGLAVVPLQIGDYDTYNPVVSYELTLVFAALATWVAVQIGRSQFGRRMLAIRDSELAAQSVGIPILRTKVQSFVLSAVFAGVAGWLYAYVVGFVSPTTFDLFPSVYFVVAVILGGSGRVLGSWLGAAYIVLVPQAFAIIGQPNLFPFLGGAVLIIVALLVPGGLVVAAKDLGQRLSRAVVQRRRTSEQEARPER